MKVITDSGDAFSGVDVAKIRRGVVWFDTGNKVWILRLFANF